MRMFPFQGFFRRKNSDLNANVRSFRFAPHVLPVYIGMFALLLSIPASLLVLQRNQDIRKKASQRSFPISEITPKEPGELIIKYKENLKIKTDEDINQHKHSFEVSDIKEGLPQTSKNNLVAAGVRKIDLVFDNAKLPSEQSHMSQVLDLLGLDSKLDPKGTIYRLEFSEAADIKEIMDLVGKDPNVEYVEPNYQFQLAVIPNDPIYNRPVPDNMWNLEKIKAAQAWDSTTGSSNITVAIIDSGIDAQHPDLQANVVSGRNFVSPGNLPDDTVGHGTHVAGTIGAVGNNSIGVVGLNWQVKLMSLKVCPSTFCNLDLAAQAVTYAADNGVKVVNMSLGGFFTTIPLTMQAAVRDAAQKGVMLVAAVGNDGVDMSNWYPAAFPEVIAVSATDEADVPANFGTGQAGQPIATNFGAKVELSAPGKNIPSTYARTILEYARSSGTSMASPHVAGLAALVLAKNPSLSAAQVRAILTASAEDKGVAGRDPQYGFGRINAQQALALADTPPSVSPTATGNPTNTGNPSGSTTATATPTSGSSQIKKLASRIAQACGGNPILTKRLSGNQATGNSWASFVANYGGLTFSPQGELFIYITNQSGCSVQLTGQTVQLQNGWNKVTITATISGSSGVGLSQVEIPKKNKSILDLLF